MSENLMNSSHKASNQKSRDGWDRTFGKKKSERFCNGCKEIMLILEERPELISGICPDCGKTMNNDHKEV